MIKGRYRKLLEATICRPASLNFLKSFHLVVHCLHSLQSASRVRSHSCRQLRREGREGTFSPLPSRSLSIVSGADSKLENYFVQAFPNSYLIYFYVILVHSKYWACICIPVYIPVIEKKFFFYKMFFYLIFCDSFWKNNKDLK